MARRKKRVPVWVQLFVVWIVISGLTSTGVMYLRARGTIGDAVFAPIAPLVCGAGDELETAYGTSDERVNNRGRSDPTSSRTLTYATLDAAACVSSTGERSAVTGRFTIVMLGLGGLFGGAVVGALALSMRR